MKGRKDKRWKKKCARKRTMDFEGNGGRKECGRKERSEGRK